ncbi:hypothetical protein [Egbenema bharatensis]|uniref:hypothetical protein n=1 Tax=Egbenema bharatensis TaxID=3463334 RepID=UPI003A88FC19
MKLKIFCLGGVLVLLLAGCGTLNRSQPTASPQSTADVLSDPIAQESLRALDTNESPGFSTHAESSESQPSPNPTTPAVIDTDLNPTPRSNDEALTLERDYEPTSPLPSTGQVTIRDNIRNVSLDRLIADCPTDTGPYALAESTNYIVQICSAEFDPWMPKYYLGRTKADGSEIWLTNEDQDTARQLIFPNGDYTYVLYRDSARPDETNAYLEIHTPEGKVYAEALIYLYERSDRPF